MDNKVLRARTLRRDMTPPERRFWRAVRNRNCYGLKFRRQVPFGPYIADFICARHRLVVEIDGDTHADQQAYDHRRDRYMNAAGYRVVRFSNSDVNTNLDGVISVIARMCGH